MLKPLCRHARIEMTRASFPRKSVTPAKPTEAILPPRAGPTILRDIDAGVPGAALSPSFWRQRGLRDAVPLPSPLRGGARCPGEGNARAEVSRWHRYLERVAARLSGGAPIQLFRTHESVLS